MEEIKDSGRQVAWKILRAVNILHQQLLDQKVPDPSQYLNNKYNCVLWLISRYDSSSFFCVKRSMKKMENEFLKN